MERDKNALSQESKKELFEALLPFMTKHKLPALAVSAGTLEGDVLFYAFSEKSSSGFISPAALIELLQASIALLESGKAEHYRT